MTIGDALRGVRRLAVDTSALVDLVEGVERSAFAWSRILPLVDEGRITLVATTQIVTEALTTAFVVESEQTDYEYALKRLEFVDVSLEIARLAAELCVTYHLETVDSTHLATALTTGCEALLTADGDFTRVRGYPLPNSPERAFRVLLTRQLKPG